jgi:hypothetical protein
MREVMYAMRFAGQAEPAGGTGAALRAATSAPSSALTISVGLDGLAGTLASAPVAGATFTWEVTFAGETSFQKTGATGLIASNFVVDDRLGVVDRRFGVLLLPDENPERQTLPPDSQTRLRMP